MKSISVSCIFFAFCVAFASTGVYSDRKDVTRENFRKLALANNELAFNLHRMLISGSSENVVFSPLGISTAFSMLFYGSRGETAEELKEVLGYERADLPNYLVHDTFKRYLREITRRGDSSDEYILNSANAVLIDERLGLLHEYRRNIQELYRAAVGDVDFRREAPRIEEEINDYVREKTNGKIDKLFDELDPSSILVLLNAVYFKGTWKTGFETEKTSDQIFYNDGMESERRKVPFMRMTFRFPFASFDDFQALELPYNGEHVSMIILLPNERDGLQDLEYSLTPERLEEIQGRLHRTKVDVSLPKFKLQFEKELSSEIRALGAHQIFRNGADFSGMTSRRNAVVSEIVHKAVIEVNEEGSEAAAATGLRTPVSHMMSDIPKFRADHPFLFAIMEKSGNSNMILFLGHVNSL